MKAASPDFKRKAHKALRIVADPIIMVAATGALMIGCLAPGLYRDYFTETAAEGQAREQEYTALDQRIAGIPPLRKYVRELKEQSEVVLKLPVDALPAGTDPVKLRAQGEKLSAAYQAEVMATTYAIWLSPNLRLKDSHDLNRRLDSAIGVTNRDEGVIPAAETEVGPFAMDFKTCKAQVLAAPGYTQNKAAVTKMVDCANAAAQPYNRAALGALGFLAVAFAGTVLYRRRLGKEIAAEDAVNGIIALSAAAPPQPAIDTTTGQDITIKPIKIAAKTPAA